MNTRKIIIIGIILSISIVVAAVEINNIFDGSLKQYPKTSLTMTDNTATVEGPIDPDFEKCTKTPGHEMIISNALTCIMPDGTSYQINK